MYTARLIIVLIAIAIGSYLIYSVMEMAKEINKNLMIKQELAEVNLYYNK